MRFTFFIVIFFLFITITHAQEIRSWYTSKPITINGSAEDWPETFRYYDGNTMLQFSIANDSENIYVCLKANERPAQMNLVRSGLHLWLDPKGKKKELSGLLFPMKKEHNMQAQDRPEMQGPGVSRRGASQMKQHVLLTQNTLTIYGLGGVGKEEVTLKNTYGVEAAIGWDTFDIMVLEYKIPAKALLQHNINTTDTTKLLSFGMVIPALQMTAEERRLQNGGDDMNGSDGMNNGAMMRNSAVGGDVGRGNDPMNPSLSQSGGSMGMNGPPQSNMYVAQDQKVWLKLRLVTQ